jgi:hypothetical protein
MNSTPSYETSLNYLPTDISRIAIAKDAFKNKKAPFTSKMDLELRKNW